MYTGHTDVFYWAQREVPLGSSLNLVPTKGPDYLSSLNLVPTKGPDYLSSFF